MVPYLDTLVQPPVESPKSAFLRFGAFTLNGRAGEFEGRTRIALPGQTFQLLWLLTERRGDVVTREEIRARLWPANTHIDYDGAMNTAIGKIRAALCDSADEPRFIETLPKRGYRFIAAVEEAEEVSVAAPAAAEAPAAAPEAPPVEAIVHAAWRNRAWPARWLVGIALSMAAAALAYSFLPKPLPAPRVVKYTALTNDGTRKIGPLLTDGVRLYFNELRGIAQVSVGGGQAALVAEGFTALAISPDESKLLVQALTGGTGADSPLLQLTLPAEPPVSLGIEGHGASWSPNGDRIVYANGRGIFIAPKNGTASRQIVKLTGSASGMRWSPDASTIRFNLEAAAGAPKRLWQIASDGTNLHPVLAPEAEPHENHSGNWTPDGAYSSLPALESICGRSAKNAERSFPILAGSFN